MEEMWTCHGRKFVTVLRIDSVRSKVRDTASGKDKRATAQRIRSFVQQSFFEQPPNGTLRHLLCDGERRTRPHASRNFDASQVTEIAYELEHSDLVLFCDLTVVWSWT